MPSGREGFSSQFGSNYFVKCMGSSRILLFIGKDGKFYVLCFENDQDKEYTQANNPWAIQSALMHFAHWRPNIWLYNLHVNTIPIWVQI